MSDRIGVVYLCTGNSCRSLMAEAITNYHLKDRCFAISAGVEPALQVNPLAIKVLAEIGIDAHQFAACVPKTVESIRNEHGIQLAITVCSHAHESCPRYPSPDVKVIYHGFDDPPYLCKGMSEGESLPIYRRVRDEILFFVRNELQQLL